MYIMNFTPENCCMKTLIIQSLPEAPDVEDYSTWSAFISIKEEPYNYCYIQLKDVLLDTNAKSTFQADITDFTHYFVKCQLGQNIYSNNHTIKDFLGGFSHKKGGQVIAMREQPLIELPTIPHGRFDFKIREEYNHLVSSDKLNLTGVNLVFQVYLCKR